MTTDTRGDVDDYRIEALSATTWDAYASMLERHGGVFGGCWCTWFHTMPEEKAREAGANRALKRSLVHEGRAHASLVMHGDDVVAWAQYGSPEELPNIYHRKQYLEELDLLPDYRITCMFVDKQHRRRGLSELAVQGVLDLVAAAGGGVVEAYPHDNDGKRKSVLYNGTRALFERAGFEYVRAKGSGNCVMRQTVEPSRPGARPGQR